MKKLTTNQLAKLLQNDRTLNDAEEGWANYATNYNPRYKWDYKRSAECLMRILKALEKQGVIVINGEANNK